MQGGGYSEPAAFVVALCGEVVESREIASKGEHITCVLCAGEITHVQELIEQHPL